MRRFLIGGAAVVAAVMLMPAGAHAQRLPTPVIQVQPGFHAWVPWVLFGCTGSVVVSALVANWKDNRQLTYWEAYTCGLLYWIPKPQEPPKPHKHHKSALLIDRPKYS